MSNELLGTILRQLRRLEEVEMEGALTDADLLDRFLATRDQAAFEVIVWRHGPMVLRTCRRILTCSHHAEDAFQATFLVLFRKAGSIGKRSSVAAWLHRVAYRTSIRLKEKTEQERMGQVALTDVSEPEAPATVPEQIPWLDQAINQLPDPYREAFILCCLQEQSYVDAAEVIGCPLGTVQSRLARARQRLQQWLTKRGICLSGTMLTSASLLASDPVPQLLVQKALEITALEASPVVSLANETIQSMASSKAHLIVCGAMLIGAMAFGGWTWHRAKGSSTPQDVVQRPTKPIRGVILPEAQGSWGLSHANVGPVKIRSRDLPRFQLQVKDDKFTISMGSSREIRGTLHSLPTRGLHAIRLRIESCTGAPMEEQRSDLTRIVDSWKTGKILHGIYQRNDDYLWLTLPVDDNYSSPARFNREPQQGMLTLGWWRTRRVLVKPWGSP